MENLRNYFFDPTEKERYVLGERYLMDLIKYGHSKNGYIILTDKRVYISGKHFNTAGNYYFRSNDNLCISLDSILSVQILKKSIFTYTIMLILSFCIALVFVPSFVYKIYSFSRHFGYFDILNIIIYLFVFIICPNGLFLLSKMHKRELLIIEYEKDTVAMPTFYYEKKEVQAFISALKLAIDEVKFAHANEKRGAIKKDYNSVADELIKYKDMLDKGIIDEKEYQMLKQRLIQVPFRM